MLAYLFTLQRKEEGNSAKGFSGFYHVYVESSSMVISLVPMEIPLSV